MVESEAFLTISQAWTPMRISLGPWGHLEVVVECVVTPKETILNGFMTDAHISGSKPTPMSSFIKGGMIYYSNDQWENPFSWDLIITTNHQVEAYSLV